MFTFSIRALHLFVLLFRVSAFHEGGSKTVSLLVLVDDVTVVDDWTSSGTTLDFQTISLSGIYGQSIQLIADSLEDEAFLDITEVRGDILNRNEALDIRWSSFHFRRVLGLFLTWARVIRMQTFPEEVVQSTNEGIRRCQSRSFYLNKRCETPNISIFSGIHMDPGK